MSQSNSPETVYEIITQHYPEADMPTVFELAGNPYALFVAKKLVKSVVDGVPINHHVQDWPAEVKNHLLETIRETYPGLQNPEQTAEAGYLASIDLALFERQFGESDIG